MLDLLKGNEISQVSKIEKKVIIHPDFTTPVQSVNNPSTGVINRMPMVKDIPIYPDPTYKPPPKLIRVPTSDGREPRLPTDVEFGLKRGNQQSPPSKSTYVTQLRRRLRFAHKKAKQVADRQQARHKGLYDRRCRGTALGIGDLVLVKKTAWKGRHKIQDRWENDEYQVIGQPNLGIPVYEVKCIAGGKTRVLHCNLLLPFQGRIRQQGGQAGKDP